MKLSEIRSKIKTLHNSLFSPDLVPSNSALIPKTTDRISDRFFSSGIYGRWQGDERWGSKLMNESSLRGHDATLLKQQQKQWGVNKGWDRLIWYVVFFHTYIICIVLCQSQSVLIYFHTLEEETRVGEGGSDAEAGTDKKHKKRNKRNKRTIQIK